MKLSEKEKKIFIHHIGALLEKEQLLEMHQYIQHGNTTTFTHCLIVSYYSYLFALRLPFKFDSRSIIRGAMLHDFYLYDWHIPDKAHRLHGYKHPGFAFDNASKYYSLNTIEEDIIKKHMWPLTLRRPPRYRESMLVCLTDKICSLTETFYLPMMPKEFRQLIRAMSSKSFVY